MLNVVNGRSHLARMRISWGSHELNAKGHASCAPKVTRVARHFTDSTRVGRGRRQSYSFSPTAHPRTRVLSGHLGSAPISILHRCSGGLTGSSPKTVTGNVPRSRDA